MKVELHLPALEARRDELDGRRITRVDTHGKAMLTRFEGGLVLYSHNQLYGRWYVERRGKTPRTSRSLRVALHGPEKSAYLFSFFEGLSPDPPPRGMKPRWGPHPRAFAHFVRCVPSGRTACEIG